MKTRLASTKDVPEGAGITVRGPDGQEIALFKLHDRVYALDNRCPHMEGPLGEGKVENGTVTCPWHGWQFEIDSGCCVNMPGVDASKIDIKVEEDQVYLIH